MKPGIPIPVVFFKKSANSDLYSDSAPFKGREPAGLFFFFFAPPFPARD